MLIGGQAVLLHGRPRLTEDIDISLGVGPDHLPEIVEVCDSVGLSALVEEAEKFVRQTFVLPTHDDVTEMRVDFIFSTTPYEQQAIKRSVFVELGGSEVPFASAEDLIIHKLFAGRARDLEDARTVVTRKGSELDWSYIERWAREFATVAGRENLPAEVARLQSNANQ